MVKLVSLKAENFRRLSLKEPLEFPDGLVVIRGRNEAGKSTILEAILFGIYGDFRIPAALRGGRQGLESVVNHRSSRARVEVVFEAGGKRYKVERIVEGGAEGGRQVDAKLVELDGAGGRLIATGVTKVNELVQKLLRVSWREMLATNVIAQKDLERILRMDRSDRERVINMMMGFESYNKAIEKLSEEAGNLQRDLDYSRENEKMLEENIKMLEEKAEKLAGWRTWLQRIEEKLPQLELALSRERAAYEYLVELETALRRRRELKLRLESLRRVREEQIARLEEARARYSRALADLESRQREAVELAPALEHAERELSEAESEVRRLVELRSKVEELWDSYRLAERELESLRGRIASLKERVGRRSSLEAEVGSARASLASVESAMSSIRLPAWSLAGAVSAAVASALLGLFLHPAALAGASLALVALFAGFQVKQQKLRLLGEKRSELRERISLLDAELRNIERDEKELEALKTGEQSLLERLRRVKSQLAMVAGSAGLEGDFESLAGAVAERLRAAEERKAEAFRKRNELSEKRSNLNAVIEALKREVSRLESEISSAQARLTELASLERELVEELSGVAVPEPPPGVDEVLHPPVEDDLDAITSMRREREERYRRANAELEKAKAEAGSLRRQIEEAERELQQLPKLKAELEEVRERTRKLELELKARRSAIDAMKKVAERRRAIFAPSVESNMSWIVSYITGGRYKAVRVDPQTYDVEVYDAEAGRWMRRDIYSGGTNDQFLLAMRIAFILSLLPAAKGTYPRFLFLDEPLGSSDSERRSRIIELLSRELTRFFDQIFLITHVEIDEPPGSTIIELDDGKPVRIYATGSVEAE
ncbi:MAG: SMC family ATPase [Thermofilum sp.]